MSFTIRALVRTFYLSCSASIYATYISASTYFSSIRWNPSACVSYYQRNLEVVEFAGVILRGIEVFQARDSSSIAWLFERPSHIGVTWHGVLVGRFSSFLMQAVAPGSRAWLKQVWREGARQQRPSSTAMVSSE